MKIFLTALAIADDLGAIAVIAIFYSSHLAWLQLGIALCILFIMILLNYFDVKRLTPYIILGILFWTCFIHSGIHPTIAGVLIAFVIPMKAKVKPMQLVRFSKRQLKKIRRTQVYEEGPAQNEQQEKSLTKIRKAAKYTLPPLLRMENALTSFNAYIVIPLFALVNAGVVIDSSFLDFLKQPVSMGIIAGLFIGKPLGILLFSWLGIQFKLAKLPDSMSWLQLGTLGSLAGIGFTMSIFITNLAIDTSSGITAAKISILLASLLSIILSSILFYYSKSKKVS